MRRLPFLQLKLRPSALPHVEQVECHAFFEGWFAGIAVGIVIGLGAAVLAVKVWP